MAANYDFGEYGGVTLDDCFNEGAAQHGADWAMQGGQGQQPGTAVNVSDSDDDDWGADAFSTGGLKKPIKISINMAGKGKKKTPAKKKAPAADDFADFGAMGGGGGAGPTHREGEPPSPVVARLRQKSREQRNLRDQANKAAGGFDSAFATDTADLVKTMQDISIFGGGADGAQGFADFGAAASTLPVSGGAAFADTSEWDAFDGPGVAGPRGGGGRVPAAGYAQPQPQVVAATFGGAAFDLGFQKQAPQALPQMMPMAAMSYGGQQPAANGLGQQPMASRGALMFDPSAGIIGGDFTPSIGSGAAVYSGGSRVQAAPKAKMDDFLNINLKAQANAGKAPPPRVSMAAMVTKTDDCGNFAGGEPWGGAQPPPMAAAAPKPYSAPIMLSSDGGMSGGFVPMRAALPTNTGTSGTVQRGRVGSFGDMLGFKLKPKPPPAPLPNQRVGMAQMMGGRNDLFG